MDLAMYMSSTVCKVDGCEEPKSPKRKGDLCEHHYKAARSVTGVWVHGRRYRFCDHHKGLHTAEAFPDVKKSCPRGLLENRLAKAKQGRGQQRARIPARAPPPPQPDATLQGSLAVWAAAAIAGPPAAVPPVPGHRPAAGHLRGRGPITITTQLAHAAPRPGGLVTCLSAPLPPAPVAPPAAGPAAQGPPTPGAAAATGEATEAAGPTDWRADLGIGIATIQAPAATHHLPTPYPTPPATPANSPPPLLPPTACPRPGVAAPPSAFAYPSPGATRQRMAYSVMKRTPSEAQELEPHILQSYFAWASLAPQVVVDRWIASTSALLVIRSLHLDGRAAPHACQWLGCRTDGVAAPAAPRMSRVAVVAGEMGASLRLTGGPLGPLRLRFGWASWDLVPGPDGSLPLPPLPATGLAVVESYRGEALGPWLPLLVVPSRGVADELEALAGRAGADGLVPFLVELGWLLTLDGAAAAAQAALAWGAGHEGWASWAQANLRRLMAHPAPHTDEAYLAGQLLGACRRWGLAQCAEAVGGIPARLHLAHQPAAPAVAAAPATVPGVAAGAAGLGAGTAAGGAPPLGAMPPAAPAGEGFGAWLPLGPQQPAAPAGEGVGAWPPLGAQQPAAPAGEGVGAWPPMGAPGAPAQAMGVVVGEEEDVEWQRILEDILTSSAEGREALQGSHAAVQLVSC